MDLVEYFRSSEYQRSRKAPAEHPYPPDDAGMVLTILSWLCLVVGTVTISVALFIFGTWAMLVPGVLLLFAVTPLHRAQQARFADRVLPVYEHEMLLPMDFAPSRALRLAFWSFAQQVARPGNSTNDHAAHIIEVYVDMVGAWADDIEDKRETPHSR